MIHLLQTHSLAIITDNKLIICKNPEHSVPSWTESDLTGGDTVRICSSSNQMRLSDELAILTNDGRVLAGYNLIKPRLADLTLTVKNLFGADASNIQGLCIKGQSLVIWTNFRVGVIHLGLGSGPLATYQCKFPSEINLISISNCYCIIKTNNNRLFGIMHYRWEGPYASTMGVPMDFNDLTELAFHDVENIREIHTGEFMILLWMEDMSVYGCVYHGPRGTRSPFARVPFPEGESVVKIVHTGYHVIYVTAAGNCYCQDTRTGYDWSRSPVPVRELEGCVENVVVVNRDSIVAQCRTQSVSKTYLVDLIMHQGQLTFRIVPLPFFDNIPIRSASQLSLLTCFVTDDGCVYWSHNIYDTEPIITRDPFFDSNLLAIESNAARIRSAGSVLGDA